MKLSPYFQLTAGGDCVFNVEAVKIKFGFCALHEVGAEARAFGMKRVAIFTDKNVAKLEPVFIATNSVKKAGLDVAVYKEVEVEPTDRSFKAGAEFAKEGKFDGYISVRDGSVMDTCKAANLYSTYPAEFINYVNAPIRKTVPLPGPLKPHIACPTTFGTASECTGIAIFNFPEMKAKTVTSVPACVPIWESLIPIPSKHNLRWCVRQTDLMYSATPVNLLRHGHLPSVRHRPIPVNGRSVRVQTHTVISLALRQSG
jgi:alcohol dehydrogenase YqhD (iron-dependent ADH family)